MDTTTIDDNPGGALTAPALFRWAARLFKSPRGFFAALAATGGYRAPVLFALFWLFLSAVVELLYSFVLPRPQPLGTVARVLWLAAGPPLVLLLGALVAAVLFVIWHLMGSKRGYETAFRCWAFLTPLSLATALLSPVPYLGVVVLGFWFYLLVLASVELHALPAGRSWTVWGSFFGVFLLLILGGAVLQDVTRRQGWTGTAAAPAPIPLEEVPIDDGEEEPVDAPAPAEEEEKAP